MSVRGVLFDLDGTLLDHAAAMDEAVTAGFPDRDPGPLAARWTELAWEADRRYLAGDLDWTGQRRFRVTALARELGLGDWDEARADAWLAGYLARYEAAWRAFPDVGPALAALRGRRLGVVTNGDGVGQRAKVERLGLGAVLPYVLASGAAGAAKPDPRIFRAACAGLGLAPGEVAYVGDRLEVDARGAAAAGLHGVWLDRAGAGGAEDVSRIASLAELPALLDAVG
ncbi:HAD family hydrolase [Actinomadura parmotrematis]|uniref:HAD family hydrolase n=1 Tax=Actinomadura parmotrematis TaxID=2864039 RepID=A0ABS7FUU3_9ACTN|nr:HAD family hydrolase [Actinomadura parmotrematis]MBW8484096.1 HAD family hydrolase [Actinomadura parmotrematis]